jgi:DNA polymerase III subunit epsilon
LILTPLIIGVHSLDFVAVDVETANANMASICQIGIATFCNGQVVESWESLIDPCDFFDEINVSVHGITQKDVQGSPRFKEIYDEIRAKLESSISVCHTHFDRVSLHQATIQHGLPTISTLWLDSARVARRTWQECAWKGYGLSNVCEIIGYEFTHHNALEDAKAAGMILRAAMSKTGLDLHGWLKRVALPIDPNNSAAGGNINREGNPEGEFYGEVLVFTGALDIPRVEAASLAAKVGCSVASGVTKKTTILVVGDQDVVKLAGKKKSSKHTKAEELIRKGQQIRILRESDFKKLVASVEEYA